MMRIRIYNQSVSGDRIATAPRDSSPSSRQRGQSAFEFVFAMLWIIALAAVLFQAMKFELDVFNKMGILRYKVFKEAHQNQDTTDSRTISDEIQGEDLGDLTSYNVPFQDVDETLHYGPKTFYVQCGTKFFFPGGEAGVTALKVAIGGGIIADHIEQSSGNMNSFFSVLGSGAGALSSICG